MHSLRTLIQQFEILPSQNTVQSTTGKKAKPAIQMIKLKCYYLPPYYYKYFYCFLFVCFVFLITTTGLAVQSWQGQIPSLIPLESYWVEGPSWLVPIWRGPSVCFTQAQCTLVITVMVRRSLRWCGYKYKPWSDPSCS